MDLTEFLYLCRLYLESLLMIKQEDIQAIAEINRKVEKVVIVTHYNPDGDALGSSLALYHHYKNGGFDVKVLLPNQFPSFLAWMPGSENIVIAERQAKQAKNIIQEADLLYVVDMNAPHRAGEFLEPAIKESRAFKILIDHHINPDIDCNVIFSKPGASSTCQLIYEFLFENLKISKEKLTLEMAICIYVGIITDTGSLTYSCNDPKLYLILSQLIERGVNGEMAHRLVYDNYEESRIHLLGLSLSRRLKILPEYATAYIYLSQEDLQNCHYQIGDTEGFVNYGLTMRKIHLAAIFVQRKNKIRVSFRSKGNFDVNLLARTHFSGGGHRNAAAAYHNDTLENTLKYFEALLPQYQKELLLPYQNEFCQ